MSDDATTQWLTPSDAEAFALAEGAVGWIDAPALDAASVVAARADALRAECDQLETLRAATRTEATEAARTAVAGEVAALSAEWAAQAASLRERAAQLAVELASALVRERVGSNEETFGAWLTRWAGTRADVAPTRLRVAPGSGALAATWAARHGAEPEVLEDPALAMGDAVFEYPDGRVDARIASLLGDALPDVRAELLDDH